MTIKLFIKPYSNPSANADEFEKLEPILLVDLINMELQKSKPLSRLEKLQIAIEKGFKYDSDTGIITSNLGREISAKDPKNNIVIQLWNEGKRFGIFGHQFAWFITYNEIPEEIKHLNGLNDDNRIINLKSVTHQENHLDKKAKGYTWNKKSQMWFAQMSVNGKIIHLGKYHNEEDARQAYLDAKKMYYNK